MFISQSLLFKLAIALAVWIAYLFLVACFLKAKNKNRFTKMQRIVKKKKDAEQERLKMIIDAENYERIGRYQEAAILYEESGEPEKARQCKMLADYMQIFNH